MRRIILVFFVLIIGACAKPTLEPLAIYPGLANELLANLQGQGARFQSLKGMANMKLKYGSRSMNFSSAVVLQKPDNMRLEVLSPFGASYLQASSDGHRLNLYVPTKGRFFSGPPNPENLQMLTQMPIEIDDMVALMLYEIPVLPGQVSGLTARGQDGYTLTLQRDDQRQEIWFDREKRLVSSFWYRGEDLEVEIAYDEFAYGSGFPEKIRLSQPGANAFMQAVFKSPEVNVPVDPELFSLKPPSGVPVEPFPARVDGGTGG